MNICLKKILVSRCTEGIYLRWWFNGYHYFNFTNGYEINMTTTSMDVQVSQFFSVISKIERDTRIKSEYDYKVTLHGITAANIAGFTGLLIAEKVEQYEGAVWREVDITRGEHTIKEEGTNGYILDFEIRRKELPGSSSVYQKTLRLFIGDTLCDMDDDEVVPQTKQVNNIAEMQDRQSDFTAEFRIRKTRAMRALFELSGEVGATTWFPYQQQPCRLVQDNIEIITGGILVLDRVDEQYYYVSIVSGNINFFKTIEALRISDLTLATMDHTWDVATMAATHAVTSPTPDYVYPLCEPSDDGGIAPLTDDGDRVEMYGGWIWCFCKVKTIWEEIMLNSGFTVTGGDILESEIFDKLYMPIIRREKTNTDPYLFSMYWGYSSLTLPINAYIGNVDFPGAQIIQGDATFLSGAYHYPYNGTYKIRFFAVQGTFLSLISVYVYSGGGLNGVMTEVGGSIFFGRTFEYEITGAVAGDSLQLVVPEATTWYYWAWTITKIEGATIGLGSTISPKDHLPNITQIDFVKMVCHLFGLVPDVTARDRKIRFWNYQELYENIPHARDWSNYLSESDDSVEFKFGDYARNNYLRYKESEDVIPDNGMGNMPIEDQTLPEYKDLVTLAVSTADEVKILLTNFSVDVARIAFNKYNAADDVYDANKSIDARLVYVDFTRSTASPPYDKTFGIRATVGAGAATDITKPRKASTVEIAFSSLIPYYSYISRLLTKTNMRRAKFNLPVYEVAGIKHNVPIYLRQYKAYFYVNKISNYVPGKLCTIDLIRL